MTIRRSDAAKAASCNIEPWEPFPDQEEEAIGSGDPIDSGDPIYGGALPVEKDTTVAQDSLITIQIEEANYGMFEEREALAALSVPFYGSHGSGGSYSGNYFAAMDGVMLEVPTLNDDFDSLVVRCDWQTGDPIPNDIENLKAYIALQKQVEALFAPLQKEEEED